MMPIMRSGPKACTVVGVKDCTMDEKTRQGRLRFCRQRGRAALTRVMRLIPRVLAGGRLPVLVRTKPAAMHSAILSVGTNAG